MNTSIIITDELLSKVRNLFSTKTVFNNDAIAYEIQDSYRHLLISISIDNFSEGNSFLPFKPVADLLNGLIPGRHGDYTWMVVFTKNDKVVDSYFGGDLDHPTIGL